MAASFSTRKPPRDKRWLVFFCLALLSLYASGQTTLYTYQSGTWDKIDVWTTDPGGTTLVGSKIPGNGDAVVVLPSRTLSLSGNVSNTGLNLTILPGGTFDASSFSFTNPLVSLSGQGTYRLSSADFPTAGTITFTGAGGGTVEYYNTADFNLPVAQTSYFNLKINCSGFTAIQLNNLTINGNLTVLSGTFRINDGTATRRTLVVNGDLEVHTGAYMSIGTGNTTTTADPTATGSGGTAPFIDYYVAQSHRIEIYGNLTNNGSVRFTNQDYPVFNQFPANGFASVFFRGAADKSITCNGTTDFYNLIVDKGTDQTYVLSVNSSGYDKFRLFGANNAGEIDRTDEANPDILKALWIRNGTLRLNGYSFLPSLTEGGGDFIIPGNGALEINSPDAVVMTTIDDYFVTELAYGVSGAVGLNGVETGSVTQTDLALFGKLQVNDGKLYVGEYSRIVYYGSSSSAQFIINGGVIDTKQFQSVVGGGRTAYWQTGGTLVLRGRFQRTLLNTSLSNLISSIGHVAQLNTSRANGPEPGSSGTLNIDQPENIFRMEGGSIEIYDVTGAVTAPAVPYAIEINSDPSNISVTGGTITLDMRTGSGTDANYGIYSTAPVFNAIIKRSSGSSQSVLKSSFRALGDLTLANTSGETADILNASDQNLRIGEDFTIQTNAEYSPGNNRTILDGTGDQRFTNQGTIESGLYRFIVDKTAGTATLGSNITVRDSLVILGGTLNDGGYTLQVAGNVFNAGTHSGTGKIIFNGNSRQYIDANESALFGNIVLNSSYSSAPYLALTLNTDISVQSARLAGTRGVFYLVDKRLTIRSQAILLGNNGTNYSSTKMFMTDGSHSAKGISLYLSLTGNLNTNIDTIPLGVYHTGTTAWYTPAIINVSGNLGVAIYTGTVNLTPVDSPHPSNKDPGSVLAFYWKTLVNGTLPSINPGFVTFRYYNNYVSAPSGSKHYYLEQGSSDWIMGGNYSNPLVFNLGFMSGVFTAGKNNPFNGPIICRSVASGFWDVASTWTPRRPLSYDYAVIGGTGSVNHTVTIRTSNVTCAGVSIWANGYEGDVPKPALVVNAGLTGINFTTVAGGGKFVLKGSSAINMPGGDFDFFCNNDTAIFEYNDNGGATSNYLIPSGIRTYPTLHITSSRNNLTKTLPDADITVLKDLRLFSLFTGNKLSFNNSGNAHFLTVNGNLEFRDASRIEIPVAVAIKTLNVYGNINLRYGDTDHVNAITAAAGAGVSHILNFYGDFIFTGASTLTFNNAGTNKVNLFFSGPGRAVVDNGSGTFSLNRLIIQKDLVTDTVFFKKNFSLNESDNASASKSLTLSSGTLILSDPSNGSASTINLNLSSGGTSWFNLNSSSKLILRNGSKINISGSTLGSGIRLDGLLQAEDASEINLADGTVGNTGYIEYTGSGNATIVLSGASVLKADQVRRSLSLSTGLLNFSQSGTSTTTIYGTGSSDTRGKFEVAGTGSSFNMSETSTLTIIKGGGTSFGDLYLRPGASVVTGGTIIFGTGIASQVYKVDATVPLNNIILNATGAANEISLMVNPLVLRGNLTLADANSRFTSNNLDVTIGGNFTNNGTYTAGTNTTTFNGVTQAISGTTDPLFNSMIVNPSVKLTIARNITIGSSLEITSGILEASIYSVTVRGNVNNSGIYTNDPSGTSRLYLNGTAVQTISGNGSFGRVELDNATGGARLANNLLLSEDLTLTNGVLDINQYSLTLGSQSDITPVVFGTGRMIKSDGVFSNGGIIKHFSAGFAGTFVYPSGVSGKFTPATLTVNATNSGWVRINIINQKHPATLSPFNVLGYYWEAESSISAFDGSMTLRYEPSDVTGDENLYVAGRLIIPPGTGWSKAAAGPSTDNVNETAKTIFFNFPAGTSNLGGQYTAGYTSDLPNTIPVYTSNTALGDWNNPASWLPAPPAGGPDGVVVVIRAGDVINTAGNKRFAFKTSISGTLNIGTSYGHNLGTVDGTGTLSLSQANLPAGNFSSFLGCEGGTLEYDGGSYTIVADRIDTVKNIVFKGTGTKTLPDKDLVICNTLEINGPVLDNHFNRKLSIGGSFLLTSGSFLSGAGTGATVIFNGTALQTLSGFRSANPLNNLEIRNSAGLTLNSAIMMKGNLIMTSGVINTTADSLLKMTGQTATATTGNVASFVNGPMSKNQLGGIDFTFPVGKGGRYGRLGLINPQSGTWEAEYYNSPYTDASVAGTLVKASTTEYWRINSPVNGKTATVKLRWDNQSDISPLTTSGGINDIRVAEFDGADWREKSSAVPSGNDNDGTVQTAANIPVNNTGHPRYYTLGSASIVKPGILLGLSDPICKCTTVANLPYLSTTGSPDQYTIDFNAAANAEGFVDVLTWSVLPVSPVYIAVPATADPGVYSATIRVRASSAPANVSVPYSFSVIILPDISWIGTSGTSWNTPGNWSCGVPPSGIDPVHIPDVTNDPVLDIGFTGTVNDLTIESGATLTVSGTLRIAGLITNNGTFTATNGRIELNGTIAQDIPAGLFAGNTIRDLTVNNNAGAVLQGPLNITGILKLQNGDLASAGNLTLVSDAMGTALIDGSGTGNVTGNVTMQRYLSSRFGYKYFSSPFQNATVNELADEIDLASSFPMIYAWDENRFYMGDPLEPYYPYDNPANILQPMDGYALNFGADISALTVSMTGVVNNGAFSSTLTNHNNVLAEGRSLIGNPFPSPIDWLAPGWTKSNVDNALYYFKASATDEWGGSYSSWVGGVSSDGIASNIIPSMQGFMVHVTTISPTDGFLSMDNSVRVVNQTQPFLRKTTKAAGDKPIVRLTASLTDYYPSEDPIVIHFSEDATADFDDQLDALKFWNTDYTIPSFFSFGGDGSKLSINSLPLPDGHVPTIPLGYRSDLDGEVIFRLKSIEGPYSWGTINLFDVETGESHDISSGSEYRVYLPAGEYFSRFFLNFDSFATGSVGGELEADPFRIYSSQGIIVAEIGCLTGKEGVLTVSNLTGQSLYNRKIYENGRHEFDPGVKDGIYIVSFVSGNLRISEKLYIKAR